MFLTKAELALFSCLNKEKTTMRRINAVVPPGVYFRKHDQLMYFNPVNSKKRESGSFISFCFLPVLRFFCASRHLRACYAHASFL